VASVQTMATGDASSQASYLVHGISICVSGPPDMTRLIHQRLARFSSSETAANNLDFTFRRGGAAPCSWAADGTAFRLVFMGG
jgi:hypothetical protein